MSDDTHHDSHYIKIWGILCVLLVVSVIGPEVAKHTPATLGKYIVLFTAFGIAFVKAYMVAKNFMHLNVERPVVHYFLATCLVFVVLFFAATAPDVMKQDGSNWVKEYDFATLQASCCEHNNATDCKLAGLQVEDADHHKTEIRCVQCVGLQGYPDDAEKCEESGHGHESGHGDKHEEPAAH
jgi:caa(3)-type oxidase subunit IV